MNPSTSPAVEVMPLDTEVGFPEIHKGFGARRLDLVLLDLRSGRLRFCEVKQHDDPRLKTYVNGRLKAAIQLDGYATQIEKNKAEIPREYSNHLAILQFLLPISLPPHPELKLATRPLFLLIVGDPRDEKGRENLRRILDSTDLDPYTPLVRSDPTSIDLAELWDEVDRWPGAPGRAGS